MSNPTTTSVVWKHTLDVSDPSTWTVDMAADARIRLVACQDGVNPTIWFEHSSPVTRPVEFHVAGTGHPIPPGLDHVGSVLAAGGQLVWHVYQRGLS